VAFGVSRAKTIFDRESASLGGSDHHVRQQLDAISLQCLIVRKRLMLCSTLVQCDLPHVIAMLSAVSNDVDRTPVPWVARVREDLSRLYLFHASKLADLGDPLLCSPKWADFISQFPQQWRCFVKSSRMASMDLDVVVGLPPPVCVQACLLFKCSQCPVSCKDERALDSHCRAKHKSRCTVSRIIGLSSVCPVCFTDFGIRTRLLAHAGDKRNRGRRTSTCRDLFVANLVPPADPDEVAQAVLGDRSLGHDAWKRGRTNPLSPCPAKRQKVGIPLFAQQEFATSCDVQLPANALHLHLFRSSKRLRSKSSIEDIVANKAAKIARL
jgi:hypothetical protein